MENAVLDAKLRDKNVKARALRSEHKMVPAEYYGHGVQNLSLAVDHQTFRKLYRKTGSNTIINLKIEGAGDKKVLVHNVEYHPVTEDVLNIEFINVRMDQKVTAHVPVRLEGLAPAVKELGGVLIQSMDEIEIRCLPGDLIHELVLNVDGLVDFNTILHVSDIQVPSSVEVLSEPTAAVVAVAAPRVEEAEQAPVADVSSVEVAGEKKEADGEEGKAN